MDQDRLNHSFTVAQKMVEIGKKHNLSEKDLQSLFVLGLNHDIGYEFGDNKNHAAIGANILERSGFRYAQEVRHHGNPNSPYNSLFLNILNQADMQIDKSGHDVSYEERLKDIKSRYGETSEVYYSAQNLIKKLKHYQS